MSAKKVKLISLKEAIDLLNEAYQNDPKKSGRDVIALGTIYNAISKKKLRRHGRIHFAQVEADELLALFGPKKSA